MKEMFTAIINTCNIVCNIKLCNTHYTKQESGTIWFIHYV